MAFLQRWRAEQSRPRPKPKLVTRLLRFLRGEKIPLSPSWDTVQDGPRLIYTRLSPIVDVHVGIAPTGRVVIKLFTKGEDDAG